MWTSGGGTTPNSQEEGAYLERVEDRNMIIDGARDAMRWQEPVEVTLARSLVIRRYSALHCIETSSTSRRLHHVFGFPISPIHFSPSSPPRMRHHFSFKRRRMCHMYLLSPPTYE